MDLNELNEVQIDAVKTTDGPVLIVAGAGSGKTRVLTHKVAYLIKQKKARPENVLAITFTNKAANEMKERIFNLVGKEALLIQISTFHSFGLKIIRENYKLLGYNSNLIIMDADDSLSIIKKILKDMNLDPKFFNPVNIKNQISSAKNELLSPIDYEKYANTEFSKVVLKIYKRYNEMLLENNAVDFDDLLMLPITLFREFPNVLKIYQEKYKHVLIDEYQDTNEAQYILSKMISAKYKNICVVGDVDQTIYSFRGANYKNILNFESDYKNVKTILLEQNYRSTKTILDAANNVIKNNKYRKDKKLWSDLEQGEKIKYYRAYDERDEARYVIRNIKEALEKGVSPEEIAVLYRTNAQSRVMQEELLKETIPFKVIGSYYFYNRKEIKDLISYLRIIHNDKDNYSLLRIINVPRRGIGNKTIERLTNKAINENKSIYDVIESGKELMFKKLIEDFKQKKEEFTLTELVEYILDKSGLREELESENSLESSLRLENLEEFKSITKHFEERKGLISLEEFLMEIALVSDINEHKDDKRQIQLMTVHSVKGLEFNTVFIIGLEEGLFPHINSLMETDSLEEERRLCYVAITRAKKILYFVNARRRTLFGRDQVNPPSRFIEEVGSDYIETKECIESEKIINKEEYLYEEDIDYKAGDNVIHSEYGEGVVVEVSNTLLTIAFNKSIGIKKFMKNHKSISKK